MSQESPAPASTPRPSWTGGSDAGLRIVAEMLAGMALYGGLGWLGDHFWHTGFLLPVGILLGFGLSIYLAVKRFGGDVK